MRKVWEVGAGEMTWQRLQDPAFRLKELLVRLRRQIMLCKIWSEGGGISHALSLP